MNSENQFSASILGETLLVARHGDEGEDPDAEMLPEDVDDEVPGP